MEICILIHLNVRLYNYGIKDKKYKIYKILNIK